MIRLLLAVLLFGSLAHADVLIPTPPAGRFHVAALAGLESLGGDPGSLGGSNGLGLGGEVGVGLDERWTATARFVGASTSGVNHNDISLGGEYALGDSLAFHVLASLDFLHNEFKSYAVSGSAVGISVGWSYDFVLSPEWLLGVEARYTKAFTSTGLVGGNNVHIVDDSFSGLVRVTYLFSLGD